MITEINPTTGAIIGNYEEMNEPEVDAILRQSANAFEEWRRTDFPSRGNLMKALAAGLRGERDAFARLMASEMGKPVTQGAAEIDKCAIACEYYAEHAPEMLAQVAVPTDARKSLIAFEPLGTLLVIMPWNFPFWQVFRAAIAAIMAGNVVALKHASNVCGCALSIETLFENAGFPNGVFSTLIIGSKRVGELIGHPAIKAVTLTGSTAAGRSVAEASGRALKKCVLELGGSDPYVILEDADLERAAETCVTSRLINTGQSCIAAKRFIVVDKLLGEFERVFVEKMRARSFGDPLEASTTLGPLARHDLRDALHEQVRRTISEGGKLLLGGEIPAGPGAFYPPTVLTGVTYKMTAFRDETFGPVAPIIGAKDEDEAIALANDSTFGLGAALFTRDRARAEEIATKRLAAGCCFVNDFVRSDPRLPFGGIKDSGFGRELGIFGIREFVNVKTVYVN